VLRREGALNKHQKSTGLLDDYSKILGEMRSMNIDHLEDGVSIYPIPPSTADRILSNFEVTVF